MSSSVLLAISPLLETCTEEFAFNSDDEKIGLCILKAVNLTCQSEVQVYWIPLYHKPSCEVLTANVLLQNQKFSTFNLDAHISDVRQLEKAWESYPESSNALTLFHATDPTYFYMLNKLSCNVITNSNRVQGDLTSTFCIF